MAITKTQAAAALNDPRVRAFLDMISASEGTTVYGYYTLVGGSRLSSLAAHPNKVVTVKRAGKPDIRSSAAGRYQFISGTWAEAARALGLSDFSGTSQDLGAIYLLAKRGALQKLQAGDFAGAVVAAGNEWASLPHSTIGVSTQQGTRSLTFVNNAYQAALQSYGGSSSAPSNPDTSSEGSNSSQAGSVAAVSLLPLAGLALGVFGIAWWLGS